MVWANRFVPPDCTGVTEELVGIGTSVPTWNDAVPLSLTITDGEDRGRTPERFSDALKKRTSPRVLPMKAKVVAAREDGPLPEAAKEAVVCGPGGFGARVPRF